MDRNRFEVVGRLGVIFLHVRGGCPRLQVQEAEFHPVGQTKQSPRCLLPLPDWKLLVGGGRDLTLFSVVSFPEQHHRVLLKIWQ